MKQCWLFEYEELGGHTHVTVRCGSQPHGRGKLGYLTFRNEEWETFRWAFERGIAHDWFPGEVTGMSAEFKPKDAA